MLDIVTPMSAQRTSIPNPKRPVPDPDEVWVHAGAALHRFMDKYGLNQKWVAETIKLSQPQVSYLLGRTTRERPRELTLGEMLRLELRVRREIDPSLVLGEIARDTGAIEDANHPADAVRAYPNLEPDDRDDIADLIERKEERYLRNHPDDAAAPLPRLVRGEPKPSRGSKQAAAPSRPARK